MHRKELKVTSLKQGLKNILINKQEKQYAEELSEKMMSYEKWITIQEERLKVDGLVVRESEISLTNAEVKADDERFGKQNEGIHSKNGLKCRYLEVFDEKNNNNAVFSFVLLLPEEIRRLKMQEVLSCIKNCEADVILFQAFEGDLADFAVCEMAKCFLENKNIIVIYGDEDVRVEGKRKNPWFKPDFAPDSFLSCFYFGSLTAVRRKELLLLTDDFVVSEHVGGEGLYELLMRVLCRSGAFGMRNENSAPVYHLSEILFHGKECAYDTVKNWKLESCRVQTGNNAESPFVSVIIPSKDNPDVLFTCIRSFLDRTKCEFPYEIVIVDNGSNEENKERIQTEIAVQNEKAREYVEGELIRYYHRPMTFNFSRMCNMGADYAKGNLLLFLNDDMEIIQENWLSLLVEKAMLSYAGAVGAKLLYPDSDIIQHAGITNLRVGPAHKLQFLSDKTDWYYGRNRGVHNMLAVTGACLLVKKSVFEQVGGFEEALAVAFNDVDLCYKIFEAGYYNIVRNDVTLYHHESLSRGKDGESEEKQLRLLREKDVLYEKHQKIYGTDPFYHKYLTNDMLESEYSPAFSYQVTLDMPWAKVTAKDRLPENIRQDGCVVIGMEGAMDIYKWKYGVAPGKGEAEPKAEDMGYYFQGYSFVIGANNACYKKTLLLENKENKQVLYIAVQDKYRPDIRKNLADQLNVDLTGFAGKVRLEDIPDGEYRFGMLEEDRCSRQKLVNWSSWVLQVDGSLKQVEDPEAKRNKP